MPKSSCIPKHTVERMKQAIRDGDINIKELFNMPSSNERRAVFEQFASSELAQEINVAFERAKVSKQKNALTKLAEKLRDKYMTTKKETNYEDVKKRIKELDDLGVLNDANADNYLSDLITDVMGISMTTDEVKQIAEKAKNLDELYNNPTDDGIPSIEYWEARREMDDYISSLNPSSDLRVFTSTIRRGAMLFSVKSPIVNIENNIVNGMVQSLERRMSSNTYTGLNNDFAIDYVKKVNAIYQKSGYDISRMEMLADTQKRLGEEITTSQGEGAVKAVGRFYEDVVFKQLMGAPDIAASSIAFADSANLASTKLANAMGLEGMNAKATALEIFKDAVRINPDTPAGELVRGQAISDARVATNTNKGNPTKYDSRISESSWYADIAMGVRELLNNSTGDIRLGDQLMPFVKTIANAVQMGIDTAGVGFVKGGFKLIEARKEMLSGNGEPMKEVVRLFIRSGLGLTLATVLAYMFNPDDFISAYDVLNPKEKDMARLKNAPYNSIKIGDKYVSIDYFGPLAAAFVGIMYARKYGEDLPSSLGQYVRGASIQAVRGPGIKEFADLVSNLQEAVQKGKLGDISKGLTSEAIGYIRSGVIPGIVADVAKGIDPVERETRDGVMSKVVSAIPVARQSLPEKISQTTGEPKESEGFLSSILFGSRLKKADESAIVEEFKRLSESGNQPTTADISRSGRTKELKEQIGDRFQEAVKYYGSEYGKKVSQKINALEYKKKPDEEKKRIIDNIRNDIIDKMLRKFKYNKEN